jgi:hypothetical protein
VAGLSNKNPLGLERQIDQLAERLEAAVEEQLAGAPVI